jgi:hypothetical protein
MLLVQQQQQQRQPQQPRHEAGGESAVLQRLDELERTQRKLDKVLQHLAATQEQAEAHKSAAPLHEPMPVVSRRRAAAAVPASAAAPVAVGEFFCFFHPRILCMHACAALLSCC